MISSQELAISIKREAKSRKRPIGKMLLECGLSVNTLSSMQSGGYFPRLEAIVKIADFLDCSVDYLLGRTDIPAVARGLSQRESSTVPFRPVGQVKELVDIFSTLDTVQQNSALAFAKFLAEGGTLPSSTEETLAEAK